jgi:hypothetical protein
MYAESTNRWGILKIEKSKLKNKIPEPMQNPQIGGDTEDRKVQIQKSIPESMPNQQIAWGY